MSLLFIGAGLIIVSFYAFEFSERLAMWTLDYLSGFGSNIGNCYVRWGIGQCINASWF
jgi:hypothetical protein